MDDETQKLSIIEKVWIAIAIILAICGVITGIVYGCDGDMYDVMVVLGSIASVAVVIVVIVVIYKFYSLLKAIYNKLDSFDIPTKPVIKSGVSSTNDSGDQKEEESIAEQPIENKTDDSDLADWKERSIRGIKAGIANGKIDEERGEELIRRVQAATQIPEPKK